ncbi:ComEC/Rec2 family competence protein [Mycobacterium asiaticum]|uniref:ComEC/Rec2 family competence protein n=1 Tax=Mycobacterium asiaticum TaxID=1790 RepID=UPI0009BD199E|nr:ComEC/Rec2 family competence protein [Mycobacterium asiaticum]
MRLVPAALASWLVTAAGTLRPIGSTLAGCCVVIVAVCGALCWWARRRRAARLAAISAGLFAVGLVGTGYGLAIALRADEVAHHPIRAAFGTGAPVTVVPTESALAAGSSRLMFRANLLMLRDTEISGRVTVFARTSDFDELTVGQPVRFAARISRPTRHDLTVAVLTATGQPTLGRAGPVHRAANIVRTEFTAAVHRVLPADQAAMLPALVLGDTSLISTGTSGEFRAAGMTHLMAVSGANVTIVCAAVLLSAYLIGPRAAVLLAGLALTGFVVLVQPTPSVLRAAVMGAIALVAMLTSRRRQAIPALATTVLVLLAVAPHLAVDLGFALSVVATAALVVVAPTWSRGLVVRGWPKPMADAVAVAGAAQLVTAPLIAAISGRFSLVAVVANLVATPVVGPITVLGSAAAVLAPFWPAGSQLLIRFTGPEVWWVLRVAHWSAAVPGGSVAVPRGVAGFLVVGGVTVLVVVAWRRACCRS